MAESSYLLAAASHELGVVDLILSYLESPEAQAVGIMAGLEASAAKPLNRDVAEHYAKLGHLASLKFVVGPVISSEDARELMNCAASGGHEIIVRLCHDEWRATDVSWAMVMAIAANHGHEGIVRLCHEWGASVDHGMAIAASRGHEGIVRLCHEWGATCVGWAMCTAAASGHEGIVRLCHEWGAKAISDANRAMGSAAIHGHKNIVRLCLKWGATDFDDAMAVASIRGHKAIVRLCRKWKDRMSHSTPPTT